jgi:hypothetical protein
MATLYAGIAVAALILTGVMSWSYRKGDLMWYEPVICVAILALLFAILSPIFQHT